MKIRTKTSSNKSLCNASKIFINNILIQAQSCIHINICTNPKNPCAKFCLNSSSTQTLFQKKRYPYNITCITLLVDLHKDLAPFWKLSIFLSYQYCRKFQPLQKPSRCQILLFLMTSHHDALLSRLGVQQLLLMYKGCC